MKILKIAAGAIGLLLAAIAATLAVGVPGGFVTSAIEEQVAEATGYQLDIDGDTTIRLWPLTLVTLNKIALHDPKDASSSERLRAESVQAELSLRSLFTGTPKIRELTISRPVLTLPMARERVAAPQPPAQTGRRIGELPAVIDRVTIADGAVIFRDARNRVEKRIEQINIKAVATLDRRVDLLADGKAGPHAIKLEAKASLPDQIAAAEIDSLALPVEFKLEALSILPQVVSGSAEMRLKGATIGINSLTGMLGTAQFSGYASIEATAKPLLKANLDFKQLDIDTPAAISSEPGPLSQQPRSWSEETIDLDGLNYLDAELQVSAAALNIGPLRFAPAKIEATLMSGIVKATLSDLGLYDGKAAVGFAVDASLPRPIYALRADLRGVRALPLFQALGDFTAVDGKMQAQVDMRSSGRSQSELLSKLSGTAAVAFHDGAIRGINLAQMIRSLTSRVLNGWQEDKTEATDLTEMQANFRIENGVAETSDLKLAGPLVRMTGAGSVDLNAGTLAFRLAPKLVLTTKGQGQNQGGSAADPVGFGVPVVVDGDWTAPRIYPEISGILDDPEAAFGRLREMGQGLFGPEFFGDKDGASGESGTGQLLDGIGSFIQGLGAPGKEGATKEERTSDETRKDETRKDETKKTSGAKRDAPSGSPQASQIDTIIKQLFGR